MQALLTPAPRRHPTEVVDLLDLFAGLGGATQGAKEAAEELGLTLNLALVNHWDLAVASARANHPDALVLHDPVETVDVEKIRRHLRAALRLLILAPPCTHFSRAKGGKPLDDQQRATVVFSLRIIDELEPEDILLENVPDFEKAGPLDDMGKPIKSREGEDFDWLVAELRSRGYTVDWRNLNAADFGAPTTRVRLFLIARKSKPIRWPAPTHGDPRRKGGLKPGLKPWVPALSALDLSLSGTDIWSRESPLARNTLVRIAHGFRRKGPMWAPVAASIEAYTRAYDVAYAVALRKAYARRVPEKEAKRLARKAGKMAGLAAPGTGPVPLRALLEAATSPEEVDAFLSDLQAALVVQSGGPQQAGDRPRVAGEEPFGTLLTREHLMVAQPAFTLGQQGGAAGRAPDAPLATISTSGALQLILGALILPPKGLNGDLGNSNLARSLAEVFQCFTQNCGQTRVVSAVLELVGSAFLTPAHSEREGQAPRVMDAGQAPTWTIASNGAGRIAFLRFLVSYFGNGRAHDAEAPLGSLTTKARYADVVAVLDGILVTVHTRMLEPRELARAMGFPRDYVVVGGKTDVTKQIGNAWAVPVGRALVRTLLSDEDEPLVRLVPKEAPSEPRRVDDATGVRVHRPRPRRSSAGRQATLVRYA